jgi:hypothetical protein
MIMCSLLVLSLNSSELALKTAQAACCKQLCVIALQTNHWPSKQANQANNGWICWMFQQAYSALQMHQH